MKKLIAILAVSVLPLLATAQSNPITGALNLAGTVLEGPWGVAGGYGHSISGIGNNVAFEIVTYDLVPSTNSAIPGFASGPIVGFDQLFGGHRKQLNSISGGWDASYSGKPLSFIGSTFLTNVVATASLYQVVATPKSGGTIGAITGTSVTIDTGLEWENFHLKAIGLYENRNGQGVFDGNYLLGGLALTHAF